MTPDKGDFSDPAARARRTDAATATDRREARLLRQGAIHLAVFCGVIVALVAVIVWKLFPNRPSGEELADAARRSHLSQMAELIGPARAPEHFRGTWRRPVQVANHDVRRLRVRAEQGEVRVGVWTQCAPPADECAAGEHPARVERDPAGRIVRIALETAIPEGRIRLLIAPGRDASAPILLLTEAQDAGHTWKVLSGPQIPIERERSGVVPRAFAGDWYWPEGGRPGHFARMIIREAGDGALAVRAWRACEPAGLCDLGEKPAVVERVEGGLAVVLRVRYEPDPRTWLDARLYPPDGERMDAHTVATALEGHVTAPRDRQGRGGFNQSSTSAVSERQVLTRRPPVQGAGPEAPAAAAR